MARQKPSSRVRKSAEPSDEIVSPPLEIPEDSAPAARREAANLRLVSVKQAATLLNRDRNTVQKWLDRGCPFVTKGDRALGIAWELDLADVVKWLEERAGENAAEKFASSTGGQVSEDEAKRRKALAQAVVAELDMLERLDTIVLKSDVLDLIAAYYGEIKSKLMSIADTVGARVDPATVVGWTRRGQLRLIGHWIVEGESGDPEADKHLTALLDRTFRNRAGYQHPISAVAIDLGGHFADETRLSKFSPRRSVWSIKGKNNTKGTRSSTVWPRKASKSRKLGVSYRCGDRSRNRARDLPQVGLSRLQPRQDSSQHKRCGRTDRRRRRPDPAINIRQHSQGCRRPGRRRFGLRRRGPRPRRTPRGSGRPRTSLIFQREVENCFCPSCV